MVPRAWPLLLLLAVYAADIGLTLAGQPPAYWEGDYSLAEEGNPLVLPFLARSPWLFVAAALAWGAVLGAVVLLWHHRAGEWLAVMTTLSHAFGGACWLARLGAVGWGFVILYLAVVTLGLQWCWNCRRSPPASCPPADSSRRD